MLLRAAYARSICVQCRLRHRRGFFHTTTTDRQENAGRSLRDEIANSTTNGAQTLDRDESKFPKAREKPPSSRSSNFANVASTARLSAKGSDGFERHYPTPRRQSEAKRPARKDRIEEDDEQPPDDPWARLQSSSQSPAWTVRQSSRQNTRGGAWPPRAGRGGSGNRQPRGTRVRMEDKYVDTKQLGIGFLGKPGHTIVMRDAPPRRRPRTTTEPADASALTPWELEETGQDASPEEANRNIDELRPVDVTEIPKQQLATLLDKLTSGFTLAQLESYLALMRGEMSVRSSSRAYPVKALRVKPPYDWIKRISRWMPLDVMNPRDLKPKTRAAQNIAQDYWGLRSLESAQDAGFIEVELAEYFPTLFEVYRSHAEKTQRQPLNPVPEYEVLPIDAKSYSYHNMARMTVFGTRAQCDVLLMEMDKMASDIVTKTVKLQEGSLGSQDLAYLSQITGLAWTRTGGKIPKVEFYYLNLKDRPSWVESPLDLFIRLVELGRRGLEEKATVILDIGRRMMFYKHEMDRGQLAWFEQRFDWFRLLASTPNKTGIKSPPPNSSSSSSSSSEPGTTAVALCSSIPMSALKDLRDAMPVPITRNPLRRRLAREKDPYCFDPIKVQDDDEDSVSEGWQPTYATVTARFGHALRGKSGPLCTDGQVRRLEEIFHADLRALRHNQCITYGGTRSTFATVAPPLPGIASLESMMTDNITGGGGGGGGSSSKSRSVTLAVAHFVCDPNMPLPHPPPLELHVELAPGQQNLRLDNLRFADVADRTRLFAVTSRRVTRVHVPHAAVDAEVTQTLRREFDPVRLRDRCEAVRVTEAGPTRPWVQDKVVGTVKDAVSAFFDSFAVHPTSRELLAGPSFMFPIHGALFPLKLSAILQNQPVEEKKVEEEVAVVDEEEEDEEEDDDDEELEASAEGEGEEGEGGEAATKGEKAQEKPPKKKTKKQRKRERKAQKKRDLKNPKAPAPPRTTRRHPYIFTGLEIRTEVDMPFLGGSSKDSKAKEQQHQHQHGVGDEGGGVACDDFFRLGLASIDAGVYGGRRAELFLRAVDESEGGARPIRELQLGSPRAREFLDVVQKIAEGKYFPWVGSRPAERGSDDDGLP